MKHNYFVVVNLCLATFFLFKCTTPNNPEQASAEAIAMESQKANTFFEKAFERDTDRKPELQARLGIKKDYGLWNDVSDNFAQEGLKIAEDNLKFLKDSINFNLLDKDTKLSYKIFEKKLKNEIAKFPFRLHNYPINQMRGFHAQMPAFLINYHQIGGESDARAYISRLGKIKSHFKQRLENLKVREEKGIVLPKFLFWRVIESSENIISGQPFDQSDKKSTLLADFVKKVDNLSLDDQIKQDLIGEATRVLVDSVKPAYENLITFLKDQELRATNEAGAWKFPEGDRAFSVALAETTTTNLTAEEIHEIGLKEVERIHSEMEKIMKQVDFEGDLSSFFEFMATDSQFYLPETEAAKQLYLDSAILLINNMKERLDELFITKPKADMVVKQVEAFREKSAGKAFYNRPVINSSIPGTYYVNLYKMANMPTYEMEALAYHEGIPGHHMQIAIAQELEELPRFRKFGSITAYIEGWALYCEAIPKEIGLYANPYADFGRLAMELWRACRLVVDTGIHHKKWSREEGIEYYKKNTPAPEEQCIKMVERHIVMPSQATAYKIGMLKIMELRQHAKKQLEEQFDIREFHDVILTNGAIPLDILEELVNDWIETKKS